MRRYRAPVMIAILVGTLSTAGCIQLGEYAMGSDCENFSQGVAKAIRDAYAVEPQIESMWAGEADVWCSFDALTGQDLAPDDPARINVRNTLQSLIERTFSSGVEVTVVYESDEDFILLDTRESAVRAECVTVSEEIEKLVSERYGDQVYVFTVRAPAMLEADAECSFDVSTLQDLAADDPARVETRQAVQAVLPADVEANLIYAHGRDRVQSSGVVTEQGPTNG